MATTIPTTNLGFDVNSAFGIDHGLVSKARRGNGGRNKIDYPSMTHRGGENYYNPSPEQVTASRARRAEQAINKPDRMLTRKGGGKILPLATHLKAAGNLKYTGAAGLLIGGAAFHEMNKRDTSDNVALGAVGGTALAHSAQVAVGQGTKATLKQRRASRGESPAEAQIWRRHKAKFGNQGHKAFLNYPKELPDYRAQRLLAIKNKPSVATGTLLAGAAAGALYGHHKSKEA